MSIFGLFSALHYLHNHDSSLIHIRYEDHESWISLEKGKYYIFYNIDLLNPAREEIKDEKEIISVCDKVLEVRIGDTIFYNDEKVISFDKEMELYYYLEKIRKNEELCIVLDDRIKIYHSSSFFFVEYRGGDRACYTTSTALFREIHNYSNLDLRKDKHK